MLFIKYYYKLNYNSLLFFFQHFILYTQSFPFLVVGGGQYNVGVLKDAPPHPHGFSRGLTSKKLGIGFVFV
jgi:hypothetical protein